jgi:hypothetical protein
MESTEFLKVLVPLSVALAIIGYLTLPEHLLLAPKSEFNAGDDIGKSEVYYTSAKGIIPCARSAVASVWECSDASWNYVARVYRDMGGLKRECVWAHPNTNKTLVIRFRDAYLSGRMSGVYGLLDESDIEDPPTVNFTIILNGSPAIQGSATLPGANEFNIETPSGRTDLEFRVYTKDDRLRHFCFNAWS